MKKTITIIIIGIFLLANPIVVSCTVFHASNDSMALGGNNEDWSDPDTHIYFFPSTETEYGRVIVGFTESYWAQGGMNEKGVFWDGLACPYLEVLNSTGKPYFPGHILDFLDYILSVCNNCDEALDILDQYNMKILERAQILYGDQYGNSFIIEGDDIHIKNKYYQVATNFYLSQHPDPPYPCWRYNTALFMFEENGEEDLSVDFCASVLDAVHQEGSYPTQYSTVYDLRNQLIYLYYYHDFDHVKVFDLAEELMMGYHEYSIPALFETAPDKPLKPVGPSSGKCGETYTFSTSSVDIYGDDIYYRWDWGDGEYSDWLGPYESGEIVESSHIWNKPGIYNVKVKAKDIYDCESTWSEPHILTIVENDPPEEPSDPNPVDGATNVNVNTDLSWTGGDPDPEDTVVYNVYLEANNPNPDTLVSQYQSETTFDPGTMEYDTIYYWRISAIDNHNRVTKGPVWSFTTEEEENQPPGIPTINGETNGNAGAEYEYTFNAIDPDGDNVKYHIDWDDGNSETTDLFSSGTDVKVKHTWTNQDTYIIRVTAEDTHGLIGPEGTLTVTMPRNRVTQRPFFNFLEQYPILYQLLLRFLQL